MKNWRLVLVVIVLLGGAGVLAYGGIHIIALARRGTNAKATIMSCQGRAGREACRAVWTVDGRPGAGMVEGAEYDDIGHDIDVAVSGNRAWVKRTAAGVGGTFLFFAALCLFLGIALPLDARKNRRRAAKKKA